MSDDSHWLEALVGAELVADAAGKTKLDTSSLKGKHIALYFSAHWCPPCKAFTPLLADVYKEINASDGKDLEIVYVSRDNSEDEFKAYFGEMPWKALPYRRRDVSKALMAKYGIMGIPSLLVFDPDGQLLTKGAVTAIRRDGSGAGFPWAGEAAAGDDGWWRIAKMVIAAAVYFFVTRWLIPEWQTRFAPKSA